MPPLPMSFTQATSTSGSPAPLNPTLGSTKHRILGPEFQYIAAEFVADLGHQLAE